MLCLTDTSLYIYTCVKHFGMANVKLIFNLTISGNCWNRAGAFSVLGNRANQQANRAVHFILICRYAHDQFDRSYEKRSIMKSQGRKEHPKYNKTKKADWNGHTVRRRDGTDEKTGKNT